MRTKTWALLGFSSAAVLALAVGCARQNDDGAEGAAANLTTSPDLVISQVYGGGGNQGATISHDYVELFNRGTAPVSLNGKSIQYIGFGMNFDKTKFVVPLPNEMLAPGEHYLIRLATSNAAIGTSIEATADLKTDNNTAIPMSNEKGKLALVKSDTLLDACGAAGTPCDAGSWIDFVGFGAASQGEGDATVGALSATKAAVRKNGGCSDTGNNANDFEVVTPSPRTRATANAACPADGGAPPANTTDAGAADATPPPPPPPADASADATPPPPPPPPPPTDSGTGPAATLVLLNELKINPPTNTDAPWEYAEILCTPNASLAGYYFVALEGDSDSTTGSPGAADMVVDLGQKPCGANGILYLKAAAGGHAAASTQTSVITVPALDTGSSPFENATTSFVIIKSPNAAIVKDTDYDPQNNGTLSALPAGASVIDGVATLEQNPDAGADITYAPKLTQAGGGSADGAARIPGNTTPMKAESWYAADLVGQDAQSLKLDGTKASPNFPAGGWMLTPGASNVQSSTTPAKDGGGGNGGNTTEPGDEDGDTTPTDGEGSATTSSSGSSSKPKKPAATGAAPKLASSGDCTVTNVGSNSTPFGAAGLAVLGIGLAFASRRRRK
jgi:MYXO-CTERM domain-containing protein